MILSLLRGGNITDIIIGICVSAFVVFCVIPVHEFAHAAVAYLLGDKTAKEKGRMTIAPMAHINWIGALMILLVGFGYAEPVPVNIGNVRLKNKKLAMVLIALAGPLSNLLMAFIFVSLVFIVFNLSQLNEITTYTLSFFFQYVAIININLAVFNFIPIPPLDGSRVLFAILPAKYYFAVMKYERYIVLGIMLLLFTGLLTRPLSAISNIIFNLMKSIYF